ncbi:hypothetical protein D3C87_1910910 [compost metagenome]
MRILFSERNQLEIFGIEFAISHDLVDRREYQADRSTQFVGDVCKKLLLGLLNFFGMGNLQLTYF